MGIYKKYHGVEAHNPSSKVAGHRRLKNRAISYLATLEEAPVMEMISNQYWKAENMTDRMMAMMILADSNYAGREKVLNDFHEVWKKDSVVLNKWLAVQASTNNRSQTLEDVKALTKHPSFSITNPNNVYSLLRSFGTNLVRFHDPSTEAYKFYADMILEIDPKNPQVAARLCSAFAFVAKLEPKMKDKALTEIRRMMAAPALSKNSRELLLPMLDA
ncbi:Aminopeptidase N [compost metagenome]